MCPIYHNNNNNNNNIVHPDSFRSNAQNAITFARRNHPRVNRSGEFACVYLHLRAFAGTVRDRARARTCMRARVRELHLKCIKQNYMCMVSDHEALEALSLLHGVCNCHKRCDARPQ